MRSAQETPAVMITAAVIAASFIFVLVKIPILLFF